jgi:Ca2+/Na+ antiporter
MSSSLRAALPLAVLATLVAIGIRAVSHDGATAIVLNAVFVFFLVLAAVWALGRYQQHRKAQL